MGRYAVVVQSFVLILLVVLGVGSVATADRPNIVFMVADDMGPWATGIAGNADARTPHLDELARQGALLDNAYCTTPVCSPARATMLTSRYGSEVGITDWVQGKRGGLATRYAGWAAMLHQAGYATALIGKWHLGRNAPQHPTRHGYDTFIGFGRPHSKDPGLEIEGKMRTVPGWTPDILTTYAVDFIRANRTGPFAVSLHFWAPHANTGVTAPDGGRTWMPLSDADWRLFKDHNPTLPEPRHPDLDVPLAKRMMREYLASVHSVDRNVGRLLAELEALGLTDRTVVIFTSDHGYNLAHHGIWHKGNGRWLLNNNTGHRPNMWDTSLGVPCFIRWPAVIRPGTRVTQLTTHKDWFRTLAAMTGADLPTEATIRGRDITPLLRGESPSDWPTELYTQYNMRGTANMHCYQTPAWKLVRMHECDWPDELYDRNADPLETRNLLNNGNVEAERMASRLDAKLRAAMQRFGVPRPVGASGR